MLVATLLAGALIIDGTLSVLDGLVLIGALILFLFLLARRDDDQKRELQEPYTTSPLGAWLKFLGGLTLLVISSRVLVIGAVNIATSLGVSELIVGLTIVAIGTSLPELAASVMSAVKGHADIALGAIVGSNIFNLLIVLPVPGLLGPLSLESVVFNRDWLFTLSLAVLLIIFAGLAQRKAAHLSLVTGELGRMAGVVLLGTYISYLTILVMASDLAS